MLTGESVPQMKEAIAAQVGEVVLGEDSNISPIWKRHLVFSGTSLQQSSPGDEGVSISVPPPPDGGAVAVVVRTGFGSTQGGLMRKILFATERVGGGGKETACFIGVLVVLALVAAITVLSAGLQDPRRNRFRLVLHCIMIVTSVVPPELPMELSLAGYLPYIQYSIQYNTIQYTI